MIYAKKKYRQMSSLISYKVAFIGKATVGKTSIIKRIINNRFEEGEQSTIGAGSFLYQTTKGEKEIVINFYDTAGQEKFNALIGLYVREAAVIVIVATAEDTQEDIEKDFTKFVNMMNNYGTHEVPLVYVINKSGLTEEYYDIQNVDAIMISAKKGTNIDNLLKKIIENIDITVKENNMLYPLLTRDDVQKKKCC